MKSVVIESSVKPCYQIADRFRPFFRPRKSIYYIYSQLSWVCHSY